MQFHSWTKEKWTCRLWLPKGKGREHATLYKIDNQWGPTVAHRKLCSIFCNNLQGKRIWKIICMYIYIYNWTICLKPTQHCKSTIAHKVQATVLVAVLLAWMWTLDYKEGWVPKNWCFPIVVLEKTLESPLNSKESKPADPKGNQPWIFIGRTVAEAPILWPSDVKSQLIGESLDSGKGWDQEEKGVAEEETVGWHRRLNAHEFEQTQEDSEGQGGLERCSPRGRK